MNTDNPLVEQLVGLLDHALEESADEYGTQLWHSLIWNLHNVAPNEWDADPPQGDRTIRRIVKHIGMVFLMYEDQIFGTATREWGDLDIGGPNPDGDPAEATDWLRQTHTRFRDSVAKLTDDQLSDLTNWGAPWTNKRIIEVMIQHPLYHIGEINFARSVLQGNNDWYHQDIGRDPED